MKKVIIAITILSFSFLSQAWGGDVSGVWPVCRSATIGTTAQLLTSGESVRYMVTISNFGQVDATCDYSQVSVGPAGFLVPHQSTVNLGSSKAPLAPITCISPSGPVRMSVCVGR